MWGFKECSSCGALYTKSCACSKGGFEDKFVRNPNKTPDSSQRHPQDYPKCENPVDGVYCQHCALLRKKLKEVWFTICDEHKFFQDFLNTSESSNDDSNVFNMPQEPIVFNQDPGENSSQSLSHIDQHCCYGCGDPLDGIFCRQCTCESCGNGAHISYNCPSKVLIISTPEPCHNQNVDEFPQTLTNFHPTCYSGDENSFAYDSTPNFVNDSPNVFNPPPQPTTYSYEFYGNDAHYSHDCPPQKETKEPDIVKEVEDHLKTYSSAEIDINCMGDEHLSTILETESDKLIKSSVENLVPNPSESEDLYDIEKYLLNQDSSIISSSKIDSLFDEFAGELIFLKSILPGIDETDCDPEEEIRLIEKLLYDNSSPRPPEEPNSKNFDAIIESFSPFSIPVEDKLLSNDSLSLPKNESFYFDVPSSPRPPAKPPDDDEIEPDTGILTVKVVGDKIEPNTGILIVKVVGNISEHYVLMSRLFPTQPTLASNEKKSPHLLSHRGFKAFQLSFESPMMIYGGYSPTLDVSFLHFYPP
nr:hypothetical protein [Tanacetum cinerariifolium]